MIKSLKELALDITEEEYRAINAISYSMLSRYDREGFKKIPEILDKQDTASLRFGSILDCILTDNENIDNKFYITSTKRPSDLISNMVEDLYEKYSSEFSSIEEIPEEEVLKTVNKFGYYNNYKDSKRTSLLVTSGSPYYKFLSESNGRTIIDEDVYKFALLNANTLKSHPYTSRYFRKHSFNNDIEILDQLKFTMSYKEHTLKCMFDKIIVLHNEKIIKPCDLKTTGKDEYFFDYSFIEWRYYIQATLYTYILKDRIKKDEYFKDFTINPYEFIVINKFNNLPIVWKFDKNHWEEDFIDHRGNVLKGWKTLFDELTWYMSKRNYDYSREAVDNKGVLEIKNIQIK